MPTIYKIVGFVLILIGLSRISDVLGYVETMSISGMAVEFLEVAIVTGTGFIYLVTKAANKYTTYSIVAYVGLLLLIATLYVFGVGWSGNSVIDSIPIVLMYAATAVQIVLAVKGYRHTISAVVV